MTQRSADTERREQNFVGNTKQGDEESSSPRSAARYNTYLYISRHVRRTVYYYGKSQCKAVMRKSIRRVHWYSVLCTVDRVNTVLETLPFISLARSVWQPYNLPLSLGAQQQK